VASLRQRIGELDYHHSELAEMEQGGAVSRVLHVYARSKGATAWRDLQFRIEPETPYKITQLVFIADVAEPVYLPNGAIEAPSTLKWLDGYVDKLIAENDLSGSVLVAVGDKPIYERVYGWADAKRSVRVTADTRFNLGSGNKMFTAIAVAQLVEAGKLRYSDTIAGYFPDFPDPAFARKVTIHHLLSHTSGIKEYWTDEYDKHRREIREVKQMLPWVYKAGTAFEPGSQCVYSNSNFVLAGLIVEKASGMDYFAYVRKHIYEPLGMTVSDSYLDDGATRGLAEPLKKGASGWEVAPRGLRGSSAGGGYSTAREMLKFARGFAAGKLVSKETVALLTTSKTRSLPGELDYGYGFILSTSAGVASYGHGGIAKGVNFELRYFPGPDVTLIAFCNQDNGAYDDLRKNLVKLITGDR
jgi:CubicO group peptidase (beta-lactamase class C family)